MRGKVKKLDANALWDYALRALGRRAHSLNELKQKLSQRAESDEALRAAVVKLGEYGLTDDRKFSETFASSRLVNRGFGRARVLNELRSKRVSATVAEAAVEQTFAGTEETDLVEKFLGRKYRGKNLPEFLKDPKNLNSAYRRLRMAGFSSSNSLNVLKRYANSTEEWLEVEESEPT